MIKQVLKGKGISVIVQACFLGIKGRLELYILDRDFKLKKMGYSARSYINLLKKAILKVYNFDLLFIQNNALIYTANAIMDWFKQKGINLFKLPPYSPDLNPIEYLWQKLKELVYKVNPDINNLTTGEDLIREELRKALKEA